MKSLHDCAGEARRPRRAFNECFLPRMWTAGFVLLLFLSGACDKKRQQEVVVYTSQDREYAEPIFQEFTRRSGIKVRALYDSEAAKTVGLANRLLAEKSHPQCDVFWNNEELRTWQLAAKGVLETNWASVGYRSRRVVLNTNWHAPGGTTFSTGIFTQTWSAGRVAVAYPLFGTTATHFLALRQYWGAEKWENWCRALRVNKALLVDGNSAVVRLVGRGEAWFGLTDSDDIAAGKREGLPVDGLQLADVPEMLIPNTVALVLHRSHPLEAQRLCDFLGLPEVAERLVEANALQSADPAERVQDRLQVNYPELLRDLEAATKKMEEIFLK